MIEIVFSDLEHDFKKNPLFCLSEDHKEYLTTRRFGYLLKKAFGDLEDYSDWKNSLPGLKKVGIDFGDENDSLEELDQLDNYSEELCGISFNSTLLGEIFLKNLVRKENYDIDFTFLPNPKMIIIRFLDKKFRKTRIKIKLVGQLELDLDYYAYNVNSVIQQYFLDLFQNDEDDYRHSLFQDGEHPIECMFNAEETLYHSLTNVCEKEFLPVFREIIGKMLIEIIVYKYYREKKKECQELRN